jgi:hypothetical protein
MRYRGVDGGTQIGEPLCRSCRYAANVRGVSQTQHVIYCQAMRQNLKFEAMECGLYDDKAKVDLWELEKIAWYWVVVDQFGNRGFVPKAILNKMQRQEAVPEGTEEATTSNAPVGGCGI